MGKETVQVRLAKALHRHGHYKDPRKWEDLSPATQQSWIEMSDRFVGEIAPLVGIAVVDAWGE